jgi:hypothetical protein
MDTYADPFIEGTTLTYRTTLRDESGAPISQTVIDAIRATYFSEPSQTILNERENQPALNANDFTLDEDGLFVWKMAEADVRIVEDPPPAYVVHQLLLVIEWRDNEDVARQLTQRIHLPVLRAPMAPFDAP